MVMVEVLGRRGGRRVCVYIGCGGRMGEGMD